MSDSLKSRIGKYELLEEIGDGAEGRIFKARCVEAGVLDVAVGEFVALKRLRQTGSDTQSDIFRRTSRILRALNHPNIVRYKDSFIGREDYLDEEVYCLVTELLEGQTLKELVAQHTKGLSWRVAQQILLPTLEALEYAGNHSVIHRDLKPSNIYLTHHGDVKLIDFGIARHEDSGATTTSSGGLMGSWDYMACDFVLMSQESNFRGDQQSDIFSFGVCFYELLTGVLPFPPLGSNAQIAYFQRYIAPEKLPKVKFNHPIFSVLTGARTCVEKCLAFERQSRYRTFTEVLAAFKRIQPRTLQHGHEEKYEYTEYIGKGGFGRVFRGRRVSDGLDVAIKEVLADRNASRFIREAKMLKVTAHPHLVKYLDFIEVMEKGMADERRLFLVLEYLEGMPQAGLNCRIKSASSGLDPVEVLRIFDAYLDCLEYLHQNTIVHRDIKPGNLYAPEHKPELAKVFDLGIAHDSEATKTHGQVPGTLDYMPSEFARQGGERGSPQSDIYSIGVTLYQALTGSLPFDRLPTDERAAWTAWYLRSEKPAEPPYDHKVFSIYPELEALLRKALAFDAKDRFPKAAAMRDQIQAILKNWDRINRKETCEKALAAARALFDKRDYDAAAGHVRAALEVYPEGVEAGELLGEIVEAKLHKRQYDTAIASAISALERDEIEKAAQHVRIALKAWPEGVESRLLSERIEKERQSRAEYNSAITAARKALERDDTENASKHIEVARKVRPGGVEIEILSAQRDNQKERKVNYDLALLAAKTALEQRNYEVAEEAALEALRLRPADSVALELHALAQSGRFPVEEPEQKTVAPIELPPDDEPATVATLKDLTVEKPAPNVDLALPIPKEPLVATEVTLAPELAPPTALPRRRKKAKAPGLRSVAVYMTILAGIIVAFTLFVGRKPSGAPPTVTPPEIPVLPNPVPQSQMTSTTKAPATPTNNLIETVKAPPPPEKALVLSGQSTITEQVGRTNFIRVACLAHIGAGLTYESSNLKLLPQSNISYAPPDSAAGETNGWILFRPRPGQIGETDVTVTAAGESLSTTTSKLHVKISGPLTQPRLEARPANFVLKPGDETNIEIKVSSDYFDAGELSLTKPRNDPPNWLTTSIEPHGSGFTLQIQALRQPRPGKVTIELLLNAPNGTSTSKILFANILPIPPPRISGLPTNVIMTSGERNQTIKFTAMGGLPPLSFEGGFGVSLLRKYDLNWKTSASGADLHITLTVKPPKDLQSTDIFTAIARDAAGQQITNQFIFQFISSLNVWKNSIGMKLVWVPRLLGCENAYWANDRTGGGWVGQCEVTQNEFAQIMGGLPLDCLKTGNNELPVEGLAFEDAISFCTELTKRDKPLLPAGWHYALPSEQQWLFFAAGTPVDTKYAYFAPPGKPRFDKPQQVGQLETNSFGLYDVLGNVAELTSSKWHYSDRPVEKALYLALGGGFDTVSTSIFPDLDKVGEAPSSWMFKGPAPDVGFRVILVPQPQ